MLFRLGAVFVLSLPAVDIVELEVSILGWLECHSFVCVCVSLSWARNLSLTSCVSSASTSAATSSTATIFSL